MGPIVCVTVTLRMGLNNVEPNKPKLRAFPGRNGRRRLIAN